MIFAMIGEALLGTALLARQREYPPPLSTAARRAKAKGLCSFSSSSLRRREAAGRAAAGAGLTFQASFKSRIQAVISLENFVRTGKRQADSARAGPETVRKTSSNDRLESIPEDGLAKALRDSVKAERDVGD
ncbi:hypothetical protein [Bradyrhizobium sp. CCBAU 11357]|uniref:hypothetical protein n=1 Tax=Bradyrhizobium sp. CCBAU 11357 TaxID=1630808 RepID=UPI00230420DE|nr:hypothetical protein [Bradyrhizobium sp. CCBAU 11357]